MVLFDLCGRVDRLRPFRTGNFATDTAKPARPDSPYAEVRKILFEGTYTAPDETMCKYPLCWACSYQGKSKSDLETPYVQRNPILVNCTLKQSCPDRDA